MGVLIGLFGEGICFAIDARPTHSTRFSSELREGFAYVPAFTPIRDLLLSWDAQTATRSDD